MYKSRPCTRTMDAQMGFPRPFLNLSDVLTPSSRIGYAQCEGWLCLRFSIYSIRTASGPRRWSSATPSVSTVLPISSLRTSCGLAARIAESPPTKSPAYPLAISLSTGLSPSKHTVETWPQRALARKSAGTAWPIPPKRSSRGSLRFVRGVSLRE